MNWNSTASVPLIVAIIGLFAAYVLAPPASVFVNAAMIALFFWLCLFLAAVLRISSDTSRERLLDGLKTDQWRPHYRYLMERGLALMLRLGNLERIEPQDHAFRRLARATVTYNLLDRAMLFAVAYPILLMTFQWLRGYDGALGTSVILEREGRDWARAVTLGLVALILLSPLSGKWASAQPQRFIRSVADELPFLAFMGALPVTLALALAVTGALAAAAAGAAALAFAFRYSVIKCVGARVVAVAGALAVAATGAATGAAVLALASVAAFAFAAAGAAAVDRLQARDRFLAASAVAILVPLLVVMALLIMLDWTQVQDNIQMLGIFLFFAVLPLTNALFDFVSYCITLIALQMGLLRGYAWFWALVDLALALVLFFCLGTALVLIVAAMNEVTGVTFVDLGSLLANIGDVQTYWWLYAMAFSTVLPTAFHFCVAALSLQIFAGPTVRGWICEKIETRDDPVSGLLAPLALSGLWFLSVAVPLAVLSLALWAWWHHGLETYLEIYRQWLINLSVAVNAI